MTIPKGLTGERALGPLVIGTERVQELAKIGAATNEGALGPLVVGDVASTPVAAAEAPTAAVEQPEALSVKTVREQLLDSPLHVDRIFTLEMARPDRRIGALEALVTAEAQRADGPRPDVMAALEAALNARRAEG